MADKAERKGKAAAKPGKPEKAERTEKAAKGKPEAAIPAVLGFRPDSGSGTGRRLFRLSSSSSVTATECRFRRSRRSS